MAKVLLVDEDRDSRTILRDLLEWSGHVVDEVDCVDDVVGEVRRWKPDVIVSEFLIPWRNGKCVGETLVESWPSAGRDLIIFSADAFTNVRDRVEAIGATFLTKPLAPARVLEEVARIADDPARGAPEWSGYDPDLATSEVSRIEAGSRRSTGSRRPMDALPEGAAQGARDGELLLRWRPTAEATSTSGIRSESSRWP